MKHRIFRISDAAWFNNMDWDDAISCGEIETVCEFDSYEDAVNEYENGSYDPDFYGVE